MPTQLLLPQNDPDAQERSDDLAEKRSAYAFGYAYNDRIATIIDLPRSEYPDPHYKLQLLKNLAPLLLSLPRVLRQYLRRWSGKPVGGYDDYFFFANSPYPDRRFIDDFQSDREFGLQRVVGMNHVVTRALSAQNPLPPGLPATELEPLFARLDRGLSLGEALAAGRLLLADYQPLQGLADDPGDFNGARQYITAPWPCSTSDRRATCCRWRSACTSSPAPRRRCSDPTRASTGRPPSCSCRPPTATTRR